MFSLVADLLTEELGRAAERLREVKEWSASWREFLLRAAEGEGGVILMFPLSPRLLYLRGRRIEFHC